MSKFIKLTRTGNNCGQVWTEPVVINVEAVEEVGLAYDGPGPGACKAWVSLRGKNEPAIRVAETVDEIYGLLTEDKEKNHG